jgi:hypothetical protein
MNVSGRGLALAIAASSVLGGGVGALATAATVSSANPAAIAAAVQRVKDSTAENSLAKISSELEAVKTQLGSGSAHALPVKICENTVHTGIGEAGQKGLCSSAGGFG